MNWCGDKRFTLFDDEKAHTIRLIPSDHCREAMGTRTGRLITSHSTNSFSSSSIVLLVQILSPKEGKLAPCY